VNVNLCFVKRFASQATHLVTREVVSWMGCHYEVREAKEVEVKEALSWLKAIHVDRVEVKMDAQHVFYAMRGVLGDRCLGQLLMILRKCLCRL